MSATIWVVGQANPELADDWDHSAIYDCAERLDELCGTLDVAELTSFFDWTDLDASIAEDEELDDDEDPVDPIEEEPSWFEAEAALPTLRALREYLAEHEDEPRADELVDELDDCIAKVEALAERNEAFHFCVVM